MAIMALTGFLREMLALRWTFWSILYLSFIQPFHSQNSKIISWRLAESNRRHFGFEMEWTTTKYTNHYTKSDYIIRISLMKFWKGAAYHQFWTIDNWRYLVHESAMIVSSSVNNRGFEKKSRRADLHPRNLLSSTETHLKSHYSILILHNSQQ